MNARRFRILNVFAGAEPLSGNALCVFEDGSGLSTETMQAVALQFNLSETTFLFPSSVATKKVRIFSPGFEMPFAGHPTLGTAHVVRDITGEAAVALEMLAGVIPVTSFGDMWTLEARAPKVREVAASTSEMAKMLGIASDALAPGTAWVDTGCEQLVIPLKSPAAVGHCKPNPELLVRYASNSSRDGFAYVWAFSGPNRIIARFFFMKNGALVEDPGTGLRDREPWRVVHDAGDALPLDFEIIQGAETGRPCMIGLRVDASKKILVTGRVVELGRGDLWL